MDAFLVGVFSLAAVTLVLALTVAANELLHARRRPHRRSVFLPRGDTNRPGPDQDGGAYAGVGGGAAADGPHRQSVGSG